MEYEEKMVTKKTWEEFRETGLLMFVNTFLHIFGWSICVEVDEHSKVATEVYPARVKFRGFGDGSQDKAYLKISTYMKEHGEELEKEVKEDE